jgi:acyl-coenzyme A synthetase/AMP-(fatty) acid ligase
MADSVEEVANYFSKYGPSIYFAGDGAKQDDDVMNVSGHRLSTIGLESALVAHPAVAEAAVCAAPDQLTGQLTGQTPLAFVLLRAGKNIADGEVLGDTTTLRDPAVVEQLKHEADRMLGRGGS